MTTNSPRSRAIPPRSDPPPGAAEQRALAVVHAYPGVRAAEVADALGWTPAAAGLSLRALKALGYIRPDTRRAFDGWASLRRWDPDRDATREGAEPALLDARAPLEFPLPRGAQW